MRALERPRVAKGEFGGDPVPFGVSVLTGRREAFMGRIGRGFSLRLMAADALRLTDNPRLVGGAAGFHATRGCDMSRKHADGCERVGQASSNNPHGLYGTLIN